jgi:hypothetical protein
MVWIGAFGLFCFAVWLHARSHLMKYGTVTSEMANLDNVGLGGGGDGHGDCGGDSGGGDCGGGH